MIQSNIFFWVWHTFIWIFLYLNVTIYSLKKYFIINFYIISTGNRNCVLDRNQNQDFESLIKNEINVTCQCRESGFKWSSRFGLCVDVNECISERHNCSLNSGQTCLNLPGNFDCVCQLGFTYDSLKRQCVPNTKIEALLQRTAPKIQNETRTKSIFSLFFQTFNKSSGCAFRISSSHLLFQVILIYHLSLKIWFFFLEKF